VAHQPAAKKATKKERILTHPCGPFIEEENGEGAIREERERSFGGARHSSAIKKKSRQGETFLTKLTKSGTK